MNMTALINSKLTRQFLVLAIAALITTSTLAQELEEASIDAFSLLMSLFGGLALSCSASNRCHKISKRSQATAWPRCWAA